MPKEAVGISGKCKEVQIDGHLLIGYGGIVMFEPHDLHRKLF